MIEFYSTSLIHLSLEDYYNQGMSPEIAKEVIENLPDLIGSSYLWCVKSGVNRNWNVHTRANHPDHHMQIVHEITCALNRKMSIMIGTGETIK